MPYIIYLFCSCVVWLFWSITKNAAMHAFVRISFTHMPEFLLNMCPNLQWLGLKTYKHLCHMPNISPKCWEFPFLYILLNIRYCWTLKNFVNTIVCELLSYWGLNLYFPRLGQTFSTNLLPVLIFCSFS